MSITSFSRCFCEDVVRGLGGRKRRHLRELWAAKVQCSLKFFFIMDCQAPRHHDW